MRINLMIFSGLLLVLATSAAHAGEIKIQVDYPADGKLRTAKVKLISMKNSKGSVEVKGTGSTTSFGTLDAPGKICEVGMIRALTLKLNSAQEAYVEVITDYGPVFKGLITDTSGGISFDRKQNQFYNIKTEEKCNGSDLALTDKTWHIKFPIE